MLIAPRRVLVARVRCGERGHEQRTGVADARRREVRLHRSLGSCGEPPDPFPAAAGLFDLEQHGDPVQPVMRRERLDDGLVLDREASRLLKLRHRAARGDRDLVDVGDVVGVADLAEHVEATLRPRQ